MFKVGVLRGSIKSPVVRNAARFKIWERLDSGESRESIKENPPQMTNGTVTKASNIDIEHSQWVTWSRQK